jgi:hypothetical protein
MATTLTLEAVAALNADLGPVTKIEKAQAFAYRYVRQHDEDVPDWWQPDNDLHQLGERELAELKGSEYGAALASVIEARRTRQQTAERLRPVPWWGRALVRFVGGLTHPSITARLKALPDLPAAWWPGRAQPRWTRRRGGGRS